jgi:hypothetical protein
MAGPKEVVKSDIANLRVTELSVMPERSSKCRIMFRNLILHNEFVAKRQKVAHSKTLRAAGCSG